MLITLEGRLLTVFSLLSKSMVEMRLSFPVLALDVNENKEIVLLSREKSWLRLYVCKL